MTGARQLLGAGETSRTRSDNGDLSLAPPRRDKRLDPALLPAAVDDRAFDGFDRDRGVVDIQRARLLAGGGADAAGKFRKIVGRMQCLERRQPLVTIDEVVPGRDQIVDRAAVMAERDATVHAARRLLAGLGLGQRPDEFVPAAAAAFRLVIGPVAALDFEKAGRSTHRSVLGAPSRAGQSMLLT